MAQSGSHLARGGRLARPTAAPTDWESKWGRDETRRGETRQCTLTFDRYTLDSAQDRTGQTLDSTDSHSIPSSTDCTTQRCPRKREPEWLRNPSSTLADPFRHTGTGRSVRGIETRLTNYRQLTPPRPTDKADPAKQEEAKINRTRHHYTGLADGTATDQ